VIGCTAASIAAVGATATVAAGCAEGVRCTATGRVGLHSPEIFAPGSAGASTPAKTGGADPGDGAASTGNDGTIAAVPSAGVFDCAGAIIPAVDPPDTATGAIGEAGLTTTGRAMFRRPLVGTDGVATAIVFVVNLPIRPVPGAAAAGVEDATPRTAPAAKLVAFGTVRLRRGDCAPAGATGTAGMVKSIPATLGGRPVADPAGRRPGTVAWGSALAVTVAPATPGEASALASVVAGSAVAVARPPRSALAFIPNSTDNPSFGAESGVDGADVSSLGFQ
jgi:hypothetical protein